MSRLFSKDVYSLSISSSSIRSQPLLSTFFSVRSLDHFRRFICIHEGNFVFCNKEEFQVGLSRSIELWHLFYSSLVCMVSAEGGLLRNRFYYCRCVEAINANEIRLLCKALVWLDFVIRDYCSP